MKVSEVVSVLRSVAPEHLAEQWDQVGLHVGAEASSKRRVRRALLCIDLTSAVLDEAVELKADLIVAYHPPIFQPIARLTDEHWKARLLLEAVRRRIAVYSPHTALDAVEGGVNDWLAQGLGTGRVRPIRPVASASGESEALKLITFVPLDHADALRAALSRAGAGRIGDYTECSFAVAGEGTFRGGEGTRPTVGRRERFERVPELRMEMVVPRANLVDTVAALREAHPYEEPAFDLVALTPPPDQGSASRAVPDRSGATRPGSRAGQGRLVELDTPISLKQLVERMAKRLRVNHLDVATPASAPLAVQRIGVCAGAGGSLLKEAGPIDAFITGEMRHHDVLDAQQRNIAIILAGHTQTERPYLPTYRRRIRQAGAGDVEWTISRNDRPPLSRSDTRRTRRR